MAVSLRLPQRFAGRPLTETAHHRAGAHCSFRLQALRAFRLCRSRSAPYVICKKNKIVIMTLNEANKIVKFWGAYIEYCQDRLQAIFMSHIPESLLPYPQEIIEEALNILGKHYYDIGDHEASKLIQESFRCLALYVKDEEAMLGALQIFNLPDVREVIISNMKKVQKNWIKKQQ
jgi:hypothetical protein